MARRKRLFVHILMMLCATLVPRTVALAQDRDVPGRPIGKVSVAGNLILMELDKGALGQQNLFDLGQHTLRFTPGSAGYRVENLPLRWDADFGQTAQRSSSHAAQLLISFFRQNLEFIFSRRYRIDSIQRGSNASADGGGPGFGPRSDEGGVSIGRFDPLTEGASKPD